MNRKKTYDPEFVPGYGWEDDLDATTCDTKTLEFLSRPDTERHLSLAQWDALYAQRVIDGYYERKTAREEAIKNNRRMPNIKDFQNLNEYFKICDEIALSYPPLA